MQHRTVYWLLVIAVCLCAGCASIVPPTGGKKDVTPPKLVSVTPADSLKNTRLKRLDMRFDEYVVLNNATTEVQISPILAIAPIVTSINKRVTVKVADTLLEDSTTYRISFGNAIKDLHEGNTFSHYVYTFSTGDYFDSLELHGHVLNAATGLPDTSIFVVLYSARKSDSAVVREKPKYIIKADNNGDFSLKGLPNRRFRIYALRDANNNLIYDGPGEMIGFYDKIVRPGDSTTGDITIRYFAEDSTLKTKHGKTADTGKAAVTDTSRNNTGYPKNGSDTAASAPINTPVTAAGSAISTNDRRSARNKKEGFNYNINIDTSDVRKRTFDITRPIKIVFNRKALINKDRITMIYDSIGITVEAIVTDSLDTASGKNNLYINTRWADNTVYTLRLPKGFAKDTGGSDAPPARYTFRTKRDEDYGKLTIHLPSRYGSRQYILMVMADKDTVYNKPVSDTIINLTHLNPATYTFRVIHDKNENGKWDTGNLFEKLQPEEVIPYDGSTTLKSNWESIIDFDVKQPKKKTDQKPNALPKLPRGK